MTVELAGWLLDAYAHSECGVTLWLLAEDGTRRQLRLPLTTTFYAAGPFPRLRAAWRYLERQPTAVVPTAVPPTAVPRTAVSLARTQREDLFDGPIDVLAVTVDTAVQPRLFHRLRRAFPDLDYYDADIPVSVQVAARLDLFPTLPCAAEVDAAQTVHSIRPLASRWEWERPLPPLRILTISPDCDPHVGKPAQITVGFAGKTAVYPLDNPRLLLLGLQAQLRRRDPDLILTHWGDTWLFPRLRRWAAESGVPFHPGRDPQRPYRQKQAGSYFTYGMVLYRGAQTHLYGRWHIDVKNGMMFTAYDLNGVLEQACVSGMPVQEMARRSPGAGITAMQMITALRRGVLVPVTKQQAERYKSARALLRADRGGLVFQPQIGLHEDVIEIDFVSMYPSIISRFNVSPETVGVHSAETAVVPELNLPIDQTRRGLLPNTLDPILQKRVAIKARMAQLSRRDCRYGPLHSRAAALKWLLVVAFGYAGYKRARFGRIEAHEAITAYSREALLRAKETAERLGYHVLHMYVDGLWVQGSRGAGEQGNGALRAQGAEGQRGGGAEGRSGGELLAGVAALLAEIEAATGLPIALEGIYRWIAFLPSKSDPRVPVPNRYFGVFEDGTVKARGIALRRRDTPPFVANVQQQALQIIARHTRLADTLNLDDCLPQIIRLINGRLQALRQGRVETADLLVTQRLSREIDAYKVPSPAARAARQLRDVGKERHPGQSVQFVYTRGDPGVWAWGLERPLDSRTIDVEGYTELTLRAVHAVLQPWGIKFDYLDAWILQEWRQKCLLFDHS